MCILQKERSQLGQRKIQHRNENTDRMEKKLQKGKTNKSPSTYKGDMKDNEKGEGSILISDLNL